MGKSKPDEGKLAALREQGAVNPHPEGVRDELFVENEFFDARDLVQVKYEMLRRVRRERWPVSRCARTFGFSRPSFYKALAAFRERGLAGLLPRRRGPRQGHKLTDEVMDFVAQARTEDPSLGMLALIDLLRQRFGVAVHRRSLERAWRRRQKKRR